jgi:uncharacterized protein (DUF302 family)
MAYTFGKSVQLSPADALVRTSQALAREGFGVLTEIDVAATLKSKLGREMPPYRILGTCNPQLAYQALQAEPQIGALLPCNVVIRVDDAGRTVVEVMDPAAVLGLVGQADVEPIAAEVRQRLERVLAAI